MEPINIKIDMLVKRNTTINTFQFKKVFMINKEWRFSDAAENNPTICPLMPKFTTLGNTMTTDLVSLDY